MPVPVWGDAAPGETITIAFAGHTVAAQADKSGRWTAELPALEASAEGRPMTIQGRTKIVYQDVLVGEVWVCSGQSNMQYGWGTESDYPMYNWGGDPDLARLVDDARTRPIRCFHVPVDASFSPKANCRGKWSTSLSGSAVAFGFSYYLQKALDVPVAVIVTSWGSSSIEGWMPLDMVEQLPHFKAMMEQLLTLPSVTRVNRAIEMGVRPGFVWLRKRPNLLYNAMLYPVIPFACRGFLWYQGEANAAEPDLYARTLPLWVTRLRKEWGRDELHFMAVMLPGFGKDSGRPDAQSWAWFRDAQLNVLELPDTSVVNTVDLGDATNIHPADKEPICRRAALLARQEVYNHPVLGQGPVLRKFAVEQNAFIIEFDNADGLHTTDGEAPKGFWLAGANGEWVPATAAIQDSTIVLAADNVPDPMACRYAFCGTPEVNLVNGEGLPAFPFKTDDAE
ncbi:MAG: sialate O-acetylesterase [Lentisphaeria bacterium]|nr:sialate O-acetylesterase [Lentisphaeria bacterium]